MKKVAIIGMGYVGQAAYEMVKNHYEVTGYSPNNNTPGILNTWPENNFSDCELAIVCVPTPTSKEDWSCDTSIVEETVKKLDSKVILIKSTVTPGTTDRLIKETGKKIAFSPEYIGEGRYDHPYEFQTKMVKTPFLIVGGETETTKLVLDVLVCILGPKKKYRQMSALDAELVKYMENTYFAIKVTFANEMKSICESFGADYYTVRDGWALDPRVDEMHTLVFPNKRGYDGKCLPKDTKALIDASIKQGYVPSFLVEMDKSNERFLGMNNK